MGNLYDKMEIDVESVHYLIDSNQGLRGRFKYGLNHARYLFSRSTLYPRFIDSGLIRGWFDEFHEYWIRVLLGRPLKFHDFFFLYSSYRTLFQSVTVDDSCKKDSFIEAWQRHENIYLIFSSAYRYALSPFSYYHLKRYLPSKGRILEYGCGLAPVVTSMIRAGRKQYDYAVADIRNYTYAYAKYYLLSYGVKCFDIIPFALPQLSDGYDVVFLLTVLEHLPDPLNVMKYLSEILRPGGRLIMDYILSDGKGLDTDAAIVQRGAVLDYLRRNYSIIDGSFNENASMGLTVLQKK